MEDVINDEIKKKLEIQIFLLLAIAFLLPSISALTITDTTFFASGTNYTIHVDSITLDNVTVTSTTIEFYNLTSLGSNFTNTNLTDARADFYGLNISLTIRNINTSTDLFTSSIGNQDYNATFIPGQVLRIMGSRTYICSSMERVILRLAIIFLALTILVISILLIFNKKGMTLNTNPELLVVIFIGIILGVVFIQETANSVTSFCG